MICEPKLASIFPEILLQLKQRSPAVPRVVLPHILDEMYFLQAFVSWRSRYVLRSTFQEKKGGKKRNTQIAAIKKKHLKDNERAADVVVGSSMHA